MVPGSHASFASDAVSGAGSRQSAVAGANLPLAFIAIGLVSFAASIVWLAIEPGLLLLPYFHPRVLALVHLWLPGFLLSVCFGACYQMMPVVLGVPLSAGRRRLWSRVVLHAAGTLVLVLGFASGRYEWVAIGGTVVAHGAIAYGSTALRTFWKSPRRDAVAWSFALSAVWLMLTVTLGVLIAADRRWNWFGLPGTSLLRAHAHLGVAGFFLSLLQGVAFQVVPMFTMGQARRPRLIRAGLIATQIGLPCLATGLGLEWRVVALVGAVVVALGVCASGVAFVATLRSRRRAKLEWPMRSFVTGTATAVVAVALGLALLSARSAFPAQSASVYGILMIGGALSLMILGMVGKIVPFLVWMKAYGPFAGKRAVPGATALSVRALERAWLLAHLAGMTLLCVGVGLGSRQLAFAGAAVLFAGGMALFSNTATVGRHLTTSRTGNAQEQLATNERT